MSRKQAIIVVAFALVVLAGVLIGIFYKDDRLNTGGQDIKNGAGQISTSTETGAPVRFSSEVPKNATTSKPTTEIPITNKPAGSGASAYKIFGITADKNGYTPSEITIKKGNVAEFQLSSPDGKNVDMFSPNAGFYVSSVGGKTGKITFTPSETGTYLFSCRDYCPSGEKISGQLIVMP